MEKRNNKIKSNIKPAVINENIPYCECGMILNENSKVDYHGAKINNEGYTRFIRNCINDRCTISSVYYTDMDIFNEKRISLKNDDEVEILYEK